MAGARRSRPGIRPWQLALAAGCIAYGAAATVSGVDREVKFRPTWARVLPNGLAVKALLTKTQTALARHEPGALDLARAAVARAPLDPTGPALLGSALLAAGQPAEADRAFRVAGQMGWRVAFTQAYWFQQGLLQGDVRVAAIRLDALLRQSPDLMHNAALMAPLEATPEGRGAMVQQLLGQPDWLEAYAGDVADLPQAGMLARAQVLTQLAQRGVVAGCETISPAVERLIALGNLAEANALWSGHCVRGPATLLYDGDFSHASLLQTRSFAWTFIGQDDAGVMLSARTTGPGQRIIAQSSAGDTRMLLRQLVFAAPGHYLLRWRASGDDGRASNRFVAAFACSPATDDWQNGQWDPASHHYTLALTMDAACPARWLALGLAPGTGNTVLEDVTLSAIK